MTPRCALQNSDCTRCPRQNHTANTVCPARFGHSSNVFGPTACADGPNIISCEGPPSQKALFPQGQAWTSSVGVLPALLALEDLSSAADAAASLREASPPMRQPSGPSSVACDVLSVRSVQNRAEPVPMDRLDCPLKGKIHPHDQAKK